MTHRLPALLTALLAAVCAAAAGETPAPRIEATDWEGGSLVCAAWRKDDPQDAAPVWTGLPAAVAPFGMRAYAGIDGETRPLRQIAYARSGTELAIQYRTLGERAYDVRLVLAGPAPDGGMTGRLTVSRFGVETTEPLRAVCADGALPKAQ